MAEEFLSQYELSKGLIEFIIEGIKAHSYSYGETAQSLESQILSDADKLDALGAIGIFRACAYQHKNENGIDSVLSHIDEKLLKLESVMYLETSRSYQLKLVLCVWNNLKQN